MGVASRSKTHDASVVGASLFVPVAAEALYEALRDVRGFPGWASGVRRVEVVGGPGGPGEPGMVSEWEVSVLGVRRRVLSVLEEADSPRYLRWSYAGPVSGSGECELLERGGGTLAEFRARLSPSESLLGRLAGGGVARRAARAQLKESLIGLGHLVAGDGADGVAVGPLTSR